MVGTDSFTSPDYLNEHVFKRCLEKELKVPSVQVIDHKISIGSNPGDNYTSTIYRAEVIYKESTSKESRISFIVKSIEIGGDRALFEKLGIIDKEIRVYSELLPKLHGILEPIVIAPKMYDVMRQPHVNLIFQDMKELGFKTADREVGLDENHFAVVLSKVAQLHAGSIKMLEKEPSLEKRFPDGFFNKLSLQEPVFKTVFKDNFKTGAEMVTEMRGYERFAQKLMKIYDNYEEIALEIMALEYDYDIVVLLHGDLWVNNFLFKYNEENKPSDAIFLDYQGTFFGNIGIDLNYLFATSSELTVLNRRKEFVENYYYPNFVNALKKLRCNKSPSLENVLKQMESRGLFYILTLFGVLPLVSMDRDESKTNNFSQFLSEDVNQKKMEVGMGSRRFKESVKYALDTFESIIDETISKY